MSTRTAAEFPADRFLVRDGARLHWRLEGAGPGIVLLHGWALDLQCWDRIAALLAPRFTVLRFDRCGFGLSAGVPDIHRNVADLGALLDAASMTRPVLVGMSQGARLAIHFALAHPSAVRGLVLDGPPALEADPELPLDEYRRQIEAGGVSALQAGVLRHPLMQLATADHAAQRLLTEAVHRYRGLDLLHPSIRGAPPDLGKIAVPALIINGARDSDARLAAGRSLQRTIPDARRIELPDAGHLALLDDARGYVQAVASFCQTLPP